MSERLSEEAIEKYEKYQLKTTLYDDPSIMKRYMDKEQEEANKMNATWDFIIRTYAEGGSREKDINITPGMGQLIQDNFSDSPTLFKYLFERGFGDAMYYASEEIQGNKKLGMLSLNSSPESFKYLSEELRDDDKVFNKAIKGSIFIFRHASARIRSKMEVIEEVVSLKANLVNQVPLKKREEEGFWEKMYKINKETVKFIPEEKSDLALHLIQIDPQLLHHVPHYLNEKASFWNKMIKLYGKDRVKKDIPRKLQSKW